MIIKNLCVSYGDNKVYSNFNLQIDDKSVTCVLGESGCGKTTLLNAIIGTVKYSGEISQVKASCVFQSHRLVPSLTVGGNLALIGAKAESAKNILERVGLGDRFNDYPSNLSGGERQRVALCRAFLYDADIVLMDEPFSSLDLKTKIAVMDLFSELKEKIGRGALFVTHDVDEACYLSDRVIVLKGGNIVADFVNENKMPFGENAPLRQALVRQLLK